ncbi:hypothetical protein [Gordonia otitidis]|nr:hypothetical protein [Gordonia otitidis]
MDITELQAAVDAADRAAEGDSNDSEIEALQQALEIALDMLREYGVTIKSRH